MMNTQLRKVRKYLDVIKKTVFCNERKPENVTFCPCDYKVGHTPPPLEDFRPFTLGESFGSGKDSHAWFHFTLEIPEDMRDVHCHLETYSGNISLSLEKFGDALVHFAHLDHLYQVVVQNALVKAVGKAGDQDGEQQNPVSGVCTEDVFDVVHGELP